MSHRSVRPASVRLSAMAAGCALLLATAVATVVVEVLNYWYAPEHGFGCMAGIITPRSRGRLWLRTRDARDHPAIDPQVLSDPRDLARILARPIAGGQAEQRGGEEGDGSFHGRAPGWVKP